MPARMPRQESRRGDGAEGAATAARREAVQLRRLPGRPSARRAPSRYASSPPRPLLPPRLLDDSVRRLPAQDGRSGMVEKAERV